MRRIKWLHLRNKTTFFKHKSHYFSNPVDNRTVGVGELYAGKLCSSSVRRTKSERITRKETPVSRNTVRGLAVILSLVGYWVSWFYAYPITAGALCLGFFGISFGYTFAMCLAGPVLENAGKKEAELEFKLKELAAANEEHIEKLKELTLAEEELTKQVDALSVERCHRRGKHRR